MIRRATSQDVARIVELFKLHHAEKGFEFPFNPARVSLAISNAITAKESLVLIGPSSVLMASCFDSPFGAGRLAIEHAVRAGTNDEFKEILSQYEQWARAQGCDRLSLSCTDRHATFARLYRRHGFALAESTFSKAL
jgi:hypothetical protein